MALKVLLWRNSDDVDYIFAGHIWQQVEGEDYDIYLGMNETFATTKLDVTIMVFLLMLQECHNSAKTPYYLLLHVS
ncbi:MAG: hypothetical protein ACLRQF_10070 [Thomasclavelia ramosa]